MRFDKPVTTSLLLLAAGFVSVQASILPKGRHLSFLSKRDVSSPAWTAKQDSSLLSPPPSESELAQARHHNVDLARSAFQNLAKLVEPAAPSFFSNAFANEDEDSSTTGSISDGSANLVSNILPRAARPQGPGSHVPAPGDEKAISHGRGFVRRSKQELGEQAVQRGRGFAKRAQEEEKAIQRGRGFIKRDQEENAIEHGRGWARREEGEDPDLGEQAIQRGRGFAKRDQEQKAIEYSKDFAQRDQEEPVVEHGRGFAKRESEPAQDLGEQAIQHGRGFAKRSIVNDLVGSNDVNEARPKSFAVSSGGFDYATQKIRAINLGGWLVLEPWITPSIFDAVGDPAVVDEYTYGKKFGAQAAADRLRSHWNTWITEDDFVQIAAAGLNHVRLPVGYWAVDTSRGEPYPQGQYEYVFKAVGWAKKHGLKVMIDLHGAPASQNGFDNSGQRGTPQWHTNRENVDRTKGVIQRLMDDFYQPEYSGVVTAIELLNEPAGFVSQELLDTYKQFGYDGYGTVRFPGAAQGNNTASDLLVVISDAFQPLASWKGYMPSPQWENVALDTHYYTVFNEADLRLSEDDRIKAVCRSKADLVESNKNLYTFVGEWTPADTDCAKYLNGYGIGSRYDGTFPGSNRIGSCQGKTGDAATFSEDVKNFLGRYWEAQTTVFEAASGWAMWTWKTEIAHEWSYSKGLEFGWIPKDPSARNHPNPCQ